MTAVKEIKKIEQQDISPHGVLPRCTKLNINRFCLYFLSRKCFMSNHEVYAERYNLVLHLNKFSDYVRTGC